MKRKILFCMIFNIIFLIYAQDNETITGEFIKKYDDVFILNLPYEIEDGVGYVFDKDTPFAIDIIEISADGERLFFIEDTGVPSSISYFKIQGIIDGRREYYISMFWRLRNSSESLRWNDGRGIIFVEIKRNMYAPTTNTYEITNGMNILEIRYRILFPYLSLTIDELYNKTYLRNFSKERRIIVDISNVFRIE